MKYEGHADVLALEQLYIEFLQKYNSIRRHLISDFSEYEKYILRLTDKLEVVEQRMEHASRLITLLKSQPLGDKREAISGILEVLARAENGVLDLKSKFSYNPIYTASPANLTL